MTDLRESNIKVLENIMGTKCNRDDATGSVAFFLAQGIVFDKETISKASPDALLNMVQVSLNTIFNDIKGKIEEAGKKAVLKAWDSSLIQ